MDPSEIVSDLSAIPGRGPGTEGEREAARWLQRRLRDAGREADLEAHWVRPQWPAVHALHAAVGVVAGVVAVYEPLIGLVCAALAFVSCVLDLLGLAHLGRRITPERGTQNVVSAPTAATAGGRERIVRLVIAAGYDAPRQGLARRDSLRRMAARAQRLARGRLPGALGGLALALAAITAIAALRLAELEPPWLDAAQLIPSAWLLLALALLVDAGLSSHSPGAAEPASAAAVAIALALALDRSPPRRMGVELVLAGAGAGPSLGMRGYVRARRGRWRPEATVVLGLEACGHGHPRWWTADGPLLPLRFHPRLRALCEEVARDEPRLQAAPLRGHGLTAAFRARLAGWPAIAIGARDSHGIVPGAGQASDVADRVDPKAMDATLEFCLALVDRLDADLAQRVPASSTK